MGLKNIIAEMKYKRSLKKASKLCKTKIKSTPKSKWGEREDKYNKL